MSSSLTEEDGEIAATIRSHVKNHHQEIDKFVHG
jgi:hypothetical protein